MCDLRTGNEWFDYLPPDVAQRARNNSTERQLERERESLADFLDFGFDWASSPEGRQYWRDIFDRASAGEFSEKTHSSSVVDSNARSMDKIL